MGGGGECLNAPPTNDVSAFWQINVVGAKYRNARIK